MVCSLAAVPAGILCNLHIKVLAWLHTFELNALLHALCRFYSYSAPPMFLRPQLLLCMWPSCLSLTIPPDQSWIPSCLRIFNPITREKNLFCYARSLCSHIWDVRMWLSLSVTHACDWHLAFRHDTLEGKASGMFHTLLIWTSQKFIGTGVCETFTYLLLSSRDAFS